MANKLGYACGAMSDNLIMNTYASLLFPVYNLALFINPAILGWAMAIPRFFDAITDPIMGNLSDNTRSRWGRRKPYVLAGTLACAVILPFLWLSPFTSDTGVFIWLSVLGILYFSAYTVFIIPYQALGFEMTTDYDERARLLAWPNYVGMTTSFMLPWLPRLIDASIFGGLIQGAIWVSIGVGFIVLFGGVMAVCSGREIAETEMQAKTPMLKALKEAVSNRSFLIVATANVVVLTGLASFVNLSLYVNIFIIYEGNREAGLTLSGIAGSVYAGVSYLSVFVAVALSTRIGKKRAAQILLGVTLVGASSLWFTLRPDMPYLQLVSTVIIGLGLQGTWMTFFTMIGDVCEEDELRSGLRREGIYSAIGGFSRKMSVAAAAIIGGSMLNWIGFNAEVAAVSGMPAVVAANLKAVFISGQTLAVLLGFLLMFFYPITRERAIETQRLLRQRFLNDTNPQ
jgi:GPH family glycoside/pentoside/hexuronide:cation symporter